MENRTWMESDEDSSECDDDYSDSKYERKQIDHDDGDDASLSEHEADANRAGEELKCLTALERREVLAKRCYEKRAQVYRELEHARDNGYASVAAYNRGKMRAKTKEMERRNQLTWNKHSDFGARGHLAYTDGEKLYHQRMGWNSSTSLPNLRHPIRTRDEDTIYRHIETQKKAKQMPKRSKVLDKINAKYKRESDVLNLKLGMVFEDYLVKAVNLEKLVEMEDLEKHFIVNQEDCNREMLEIRKIHEPILEKILLENQSAIQRLQDELDQEIQFELERQTARKCYIQQCHHAGIPPCSQVHDQIGETVIVVTNYGLDGAHLEPILCAAQIATSLQSLELPENSFDVEGCSTLARMAQTCNNITSLDLTRCNIGPSGAKVLFKALSTGSLQRLLLAHNHLGRGVPREVKNMLNSLQRGLLSPTCVLRELDLAHNLLDKKLGQVLGDVLRTSRTSKLRSISLEFNNLGEQGISALLQGMKANPKLVQSLNLSCTGATDHSASTLRLILSSGECALRELFLEHCNRISQRGFKHLAQGLESNRSLSHLKLVGCNTEKAKQDISGELALLRALARNDRVESLAIDYDGHLENANTGWNSIGKRPQVFALELEVGILALESIASLVATYDAKGSVHGLEEVPRFPRSSPGDKAAQQGIRAYMHRWKALDVHDVKPGLRCMAQLSSGLTSPWYNVEVLSRPSMVDVQQANARGEDGANEKALHGRMTAIPPRCMVKLLDYDEDNSIQLVDVANLRIVPRDIAILKLKLRRKGHGKDNHNGKHDEHIVFFPRYVLPAWLYNETDTNRGEACGRFYMAICELDQEPSDGVHFIVENEKGETNPHSSSTWEDNDSRFLYYTKFPIECPDQTPILVKMPLQLFESVSDQTPTALSRKPANDGSKKRSEARQLLMMFHAQSQDLTSFARYLAITGKI